MMLFSISSTRGLFISKNRNDKHFDSLSLIDSLTDKKISALTISDNIPYGFTECVYDLKVIFISLLKDTYDQQSQIQKVKDKISDLETNHKKHEIEQKKNHNNKQVHESDKSKFNSYFTYELDNFMKQVVKICSPNDYNRVMRLIEYELKNSEYSSTCIISLHNETLKKSQFDNHECFEIMIDIDDKLKLKKNLSLNGQNKIRNPQNTLLQKFDKKLTAFINHMNNNGKRKFQKNLSDETNSLKDEAKTVNISHTKTDSRTETKPIVLTTTVSKVLFQKPDKSKDSLLSTKDTKGRAKVMPAKNIDKRADVYTNDNSSLITFAENVTMTAHSINEFNSTKKLLNSISSSTQMNMSPKKQVNANLFRRPFTTTVFGKTLTRNAPILTRFCNAITRIGLLWPYRSSTSATPSSLNQTIQTTTNPRDININVKNNKGIIKILNTKGDIATTSTVTQTSTLFVVIKTTETFKKSSTTTITNIESETKTKDCEEEEEDYHHTEEPYDCDDDDIYFYEDDYNEFYLHDDATAEGIEYITKDNHRKDAEQSKVLQIRQAAFGPLIRESYPIIKYNSLKNATSSSLQQNNTFKQFQNEPKLYDSSANSFSEYIFKILSTALLLLVIFM
jgi:hypothetical protein